MKIIISIIFILFIIFISFTGKNDGALYIHILDVGQGDAILVQAPDGVDFLFDGGASNILAYRLGQVLPWWDREIDYLVMSHPDLDHYAGFNAVLEKYKVREFWSTDDTSAAPSFQYFLQQMQNQGVRSRSMSEGDVIELPSGIKIEILWPPAESDYQSNEASLVTRLSWGETDILLTGDLEIDQEQVLVETGLKTAEILKVGHHGSSGSSSDSFLEALQPKLCLISAGLDNKFGHPKKDTLERLKAINCTILSTIESGTISLRITKDGYQVLP